MTRKIAANQNILFEEQNWMLHLEKSFQRYLILERDTQEEDGRELKLVKNMLFWYVDIHTALTANADTSLYCLSTLLR